MATSLHRCRPAYSEAAAKIAVLAKTTRKATVGFLVLGYALYRASHRRRSRVSPAEISRIRSQVSADLDPRHRRLLQQKEQLGSLATCRTGLRAFAVGAIGELLIALANLVMMLVAAKAFNL